MTHSHPASERSSTGAERVASGHDASSAAENPSTPRRDALSGGGEALSGGGDALSGRGDALAGRGDALSGGDDASPVDHDRPSPRNRVALVTGGAIRVGRAITLALADAGFDLVVGYHGSEAAAHEVVGEVAGRGRRALAMHADLSTAAGARALADAAADAFGRLDLLVNNASTFFDTPFGDITEQEWDQVMAVNLKAPFLLIQATSAMLAESHGHVVNIVDLSALRPWARYPHHSVSKAALAHLTRVAARALAPGVRVNAIAPGSVLPEEDTTPEAVAAAAKRTPLGRWGTPEDVARTVLFLDRSPFVTGEVIVVDGGRHGAT